MEITVNNIPPPVETDVSPALLELFRSYLNNQEAFPYVHQAASMKRIMDGENLTLVAGTAAGKTLAVAVPIFLKLVSGQVKKVMFLYPTLALLEDQRQVMDRLAVLTDMESEVGQIRGNLSRSRLLHELNKKVILATPDAVYWFFRKNIKYGHLLIYGLVQVDEFVVDEAHLFHGLILQNLQHFFDRIFRLQRLFMNRPPAKLHILTATPGEDLSLLSNAPAVAGKSKCSDVQVSFLNCGPQERLPTMERVVQEAIDAGAKKILVICKSALQAHRLFHRQRGEQNSGDAFRPEDYLQFGRMKKEDLEKFLRAQGFSQEVTGKLHLSVLGEMELRLDDFKAVQVRAGVQEICQTLGSVLTALKNQLMQVAYLSFKGGSREKNAFVEGLSREVLLFNLQRRQSALFALFKLICPEVPEQCFYPGLKEMINTGLGQLLTAVEDELSASFAGSLSYPGLPELSGILKFPELQKIVFQRFINTFTFKLPDIISRKGPLPAPKGRFIYLKFLPVYFQEESDRIINALKEELNREPSFARLIEMSHVATWKGTDHPLIIYSGSMSRRSRHGLINLFDGLEKGVLVSTSAVEVGVDFAADVLVTEECQAQSFLQRFGRVGRTGNPARAYLLTGGASYGKIADRLEDKTSLTREEFADLINESFKAELSLKDADFVAAAHYLVTEQLGLVGRKLNDDSPVSPAVRKLAQALKDAGINPAYGLRGTLPQISLKDEGVSRDPFYLLQYVDNRQLKGADSPFEIAAAGIYFTSLLFESRFCRVGVDLETTLENATAIVLWTGESYEIHPLQGSQAKVLYGYARSRYRTREHKASALLLYGDVFLARIYESEEEGKKEPVEDRYGQPVVLSEQFCLVFPGRKDVSELARMDLGSLAEIHYDVDQDGNSFDGENLVLLERVQGACLALYRRWLEYAD